ncbi:MAG TPA: glycosyltransferase family 1 protein [Vicinamibacterales bacterium]|jgi:glycosyltransferase involved in cell wall biosynthesis
MTQRSLIVNATAIGDCVDGIGMYGVHLVHGLWRAGVERPITVVVNEDARRFFPESSIPADASVRWVSRRVSPSRGTSGNLQRWCFANQLAWRYRDALVFGLSQLEAPLVGSRGIVMVHDLIPWLFRDTHPRQYHFYRRCLGRALRRALAVITPSQATKDDVCRHYGIEGDRVHVIHHGIPVPISAGMDADRPGVPYILWIGHLNPMKNLPALLAAFQMIEQQTDAHLVIAGEGSQVDVGAFGVDGRSLARVKVLGPVSEADKIALLDRASVLVSPSLYEGFGFPPLEAMARGCPVVAARRGALPEVCADAALFVDPQRPEQIANAVLHVLRHPNVRRDLAERGRARTRAFTWEASVRAHMAIVDRVARLYPHGPSDAAAGRRRIEVDVPQ